MIIFFVILTILLLAICVVSIILIVKTNAETKIKTVETLSDILELKNFQPHEVVVINKHLSLAVNKTYSKLAVIKNFNPNNPEHYEYEEIATSFINSIEKKGYSAKINYTKKAVENALILHPTNKENKQFIYEIFKASNLRKIEDKFPDYTFSIATSSDWECSFIWAYNPLRTTFAYCKTTEKPAIYKLNLYKENFTIDTTYNYFEVPIMGESRQLMVYEPYFLSELFGAIYKSIKNKTSPVKDDTLYFDSYNNIAFLTNGVTSLQSLVLNKIEEVFYRDNRLDFTLYDTDKTISYPASAELLKEFSEFVTNYNLRTIANGFDYKTDKLVNTTQNTKFIVDTTRDRFVYCANLDLFSKFSYMTISFLNVEDAKVEKSGLTNFVRIYTKDKEVIDVTCDKKEIAYYILAQIQTIISNDD